MVMNFDSQLLLNLVDIAGQVLLVDFVAHELLNLIDSVGQVLLDLVNFAATVCGIFCCETATVPGIFCCETDTVPGIFHCETATVSCIFRCETATVPDIFCCATAIVPSMFCCATAIVPGMFCCATAIVPGKLCWETVTEAGKFWLGAATKLSEFWCAIAREGVSLTLKNFGWQVKNLCGQLVNWFERINHWFHIALPYLITIALFRALYIYYCYLRARKLVEEEEARKLKELLKREEAERIRLAELEKRKKQRVEEMREAQKKDLENTKLKEQIRAEVGKELSKLEETCHDMASVLRGLGITVSNGTGNEVRVAYKKALMKFHPDKTSQSDIRQQVEAEEKFKLISRMKDKYLPT
ncbi:hypothetical protein FXO38_12368 [Capsicum annuum]|nr:hypothetical protein FXO38_12368 [Capsicum annuum]